jgi:hypothetical protein
MTKKWKEFSSFYVLIHVASGTHNIKILHGADPGQGRSSTVQWTYLTSTSLCLFTSFKKGEEFRFELN